LALNQSELQSLKGAQAVFSSNPTGELKRIGETTTLATNLAESEAVESPIFLAGFALVKNVGEQQLYLGEDGKTALELL
jgi:hypothetical protein